MVAEKARFRVCHYCVLIASVLSCRFFSWYHSSQLKESGLYGRPQCSMFNVQCSMVNHSSSSPLPLPPPPPLPPPASPPVVVPWSSSVTVFSSVSSSVVHDSCAPRMAAAARLCRLLPTGRKNVVAGLVVHFRLHVRQAQVVSVRVPLTIYGRVQLAQHSQVRSALPLAARLCRFHKA